MVEDVSRHLRRHADRVRQFCCSCLLGCCLLFHRQDEMAQQLEEMQGVHGVHQEQGLNLAQDLAATDLVQEDSDMQESNRSRRSSSSTSSLDRSTTAFAQVMSAFLPPRPAEPPVKKIITTDQWLKQTCCSAEQKQKLLAFIPAGQEPTILLFKSYAEEELTEAGLTAPQRRAWLAAAATVADDL